MKVFKGNVFNVVNYVLGSSENYGVAVVFVDDKDIPFKVVIKPAKSGGWTYFKEYITVNDMSKNGYFLTLHKDESESEYVDENGETKSIVYESKDYDMYITDLEQIKF
jgi:hypothetical protein